jgi:tetratricopeptide (TPR) repeat protein
MNWHNGLVMAVLLGAASGQEGNASAPTPAAVARPTFARDVAPILYASCSPCHRPGEPAPFPLLGYDDAFRKRAQIARVTGERVMPPWLPTHGEFRDDRRLPTAAIDTIANWVAAGAPRGDVAMEPPPPQFATGWQLREPDLVLEAPELRVPASGPNLFRNLVVPLPLAKLRHVEAVEIRPDSPAVHHAVLAADQTRESRRLDARDEEPGFPGMLMGLARPPDGHFLGWTPGKRVHVEAPGFAFRLWPGSDLVLQLHLVPTGKPETVRARIGFWFTDTPTAVEFHPLALFSEAIDIAPGEADFVLRDDITVPVPITIHAIYPHAHYLCRRMRGTATLPDGSVELLFAIDAWDFDWQDDYRYRSPIRLPAGTRLAIEYRFDNSEANPANPHRPPRRVRFGQQSTDEMGTLTLSLVLDSREHRQQLAEASARRDLEKRDWDHALWLRLAVVLREGNRVPEALDAVRQALRREADFADARCELGVCLEIAGKTDDAEASYREAIRLEPDHALARMHLGGILGRSGRTAEAIEQLGRATALLPNHARLRNNYATALFAAGRIEAAAGQYEVAVRLDESSFNAQFNFGRVLAQLGRKAAAKAALERASKLRPGDPAVAQALLELK